MDYSSPLLRIALQALLHGLPSLIVGGVAVTLLIQRRGPVLAQIGFGLLGVLALLFPALHGIIAILNLPIASYSWLYQIIGVFSVLGHTGAYVLILLGLLKLLPRPPHS